MMTSHCESVTQSLHDALPSLGRGVPELFAQGLVDHVGGRVSAGDGAAAFDIDRGDGLVPGGQGPLEEVTAMEGQARDRRSEEHTSELQSRGHLVWRHLLEKKE